MGLIGPNGAGKTTFMNAVSGFVPLTAGTVTMEGQTVSELSPQKLVRLGLVRTFQDVATFPELSVFENIELGALGAGLSRKLARKRAWELIDEPRSSTRRAPPGLGAPARRGAAGRSRPRRRRSAQVPAARRAGRGSRRRREPGADREHRAAARAARLRRAARRARHADHLPDLRADPGARLRQVDRRRLAGGDQDEQGRDRRVPGREGSAGCCSSLTSPCTTAGSRRSTSSRSRSTRASSSGSSGTTARASRRRSGRSPAC